MALLGDRAPATLPEHYRFHRGLRETDPGSQAACTLAGYGELALDGLLEAAGSSDGEIRHDAVFALGLGKTDRAFPVLVGALEDGEGFVREKAAWGLGISDRHPSVRQKAAWALGLIGDDRAVPALVASLDDANDSVRETAAWALGLIGDPSASEALETLTNDPDSGVRSTARWSLVLIEG